MKQQAPDTGESKAEGKAMPLYQAIFDSLRAEIEQGGYLKAFPSEAQLVRRFAASRQTVIQAMRELVKAGLVEPEIPIMGKCLLVIVKPIVFCLTQRR